MLVVDFAPQCYYSSFPLCNPLFYLETALHILGGTITHRQERKQLYLKHLVLSHRYCYLLLLWKSWNWFECAVGGVRHPQHTQTSSNFHQSDSSDRAGRKKWMQRSLFF